jgi:rubrerythrin
VQIGGKDKFAAFGVNVEPAAAGAADLAKAKHICPMCAGVESTGPSKCPKCGMALVPGNKPGDKAGAHDH